MYPHQLEHMASNMNGEKGLIDPDQEQPEGPGQHPRRGPTFIRCLLTHLVNVFFCTRSRSSVRKQGEGTGLALPGKTFPNHCLAHTQILQDSGDSFLRTMRQRLVVGKVQSVWTSSSVLTMLSLYALDRIMCLKNLVMAKSPSHRNSPGSTVIPCFPCPQQAPKSQSCENPQQKGCSALGARDTYSAGLHLTLHTLVLLTNALLPPPPPQYSLTPASSPASPTKLSRAAHYALPHTSPPSLPSPKSYRAPLFFVGKLSFILNSVHLFNRNMTVNTWQWLRHRGLILWRTHLLPQRHLQTTDSSAPFLFYLFEALALHYTILFKSSFLSSTIPCCLPPPRGKSTLTSLNNLVHIY